MKFDFKGYVPSSHVFKYGEVVYSLKTNQSVKKYSELTEEEKSNLLSPKEFKEMIYDHLDIHKSQRVNIDKGQFITSKVSSEKDIVVFDIETGKTFNGSKNNGYSFLDIKVVK